VFNVKGACDQSHDEGVLDWGEALMDKDGMEVL
jgi:hypothetical protein